MLSDIGNVSAMTKEKDIQLHQDAGLQPVITMIDGEILTEWLGTKEQWTKYEELFNNYLKNPL